MHVLSLIFNTQVCFSFACNFNVLLTLSLGFFFNVMYYTHAHENEENQPAIFSQKYIFVHKLWNNLTSMHTHQEQLPSSAIYFNYYIVFLFLNTYCTNFFQPILIKYNSIA